jgi:DNA helicase-2/ATP-dependent DNA helicase PcrA
MQLTDEQQIILDNSGKNMYISAAPGSGKSTMLGNITEKLLKDPNNYVLLVTFTNKAAKSIVSKCASVDQERILGGTFHGLANLLAKKNKIFWNICDEGKKRLIIKKIFDCKKDKEKFTAILDEISVAKSKYPMLTSSNLSKYNCELNKYNLVDFDDMIFQFINTCSQFNFNLPPITHILVDELQDTSAPQLEMLKALHTKLQCNMIGVADDDQSIYAWRGARPENVKDFIKHFACPIYNMGYNFRSYTRIVETSKTLIENNKKRIPKVIRAFQKDTGSVREVQLKDHFDEIGYMVSKCRQLYNKDITILYRNRTYKNHLEFELKKARLDYCVNDALDLVDRSAIKVMFSAMKIGAMMGDLYDLEYAAKGLKGLGATTVKSIASQVTKENTVSKILLDKFKDFKSARRFISILDIHRWYDKYKNSSLDMYAREIEKHFIQSFDYQDDMRSFILDITAEYKTCGSDIIDLCNDLGLSGKEEHADEGARIELSTVHGYKGLERDIVMMPWCSMYLEAKPGKVIELEDERRLFYVAATRAKEQLLMTYSGKMPRFIREMKVYGN